VGFSGDDFSVLLPRLQLLSIALARQFVPAFERLAIASESFNFSNKLGPAGERGDGGLGLDRGLSGEGLGEFVEEVGGSGDRNAIGDGGTSMAL
jgi:hypothetical protein